MDNIIIRKFQIVDFPNLDRLCDQGEEYFPYVSDTALQLSKYKEYQDNCFVAYDGDNLVGCAYGGILCDTLYPQFIFVKEEYRKRGIGRKLTETMEIESKCAKSMIYYRKNLREHYKNQGFIIGTELEVAMKNINGAVK